MGRREFLRDALATVTVGLAGCSVFERDDIDETYSPTTEDHLAIAVGQINTVALAVSRYQKRASETPSDATFDEEQPRKRLATARDALEAADETAQGDQQTDVEAVRTYADSVASTVDAVVTLIEASTSLERAREILDSDEIDTTRASATLDDATTASSQAVTAHEKAHSSLEAADGDRLQRLDAEYEAMSSGLEAFAGYVVGVEGLATGYDTQVSGIDHLQAAQDQVDIEDFDGASDSFADAADAFDAAATAFADAVPNAAEALAEDLRYGDQQSRSLDELSTGYVALLESHDQVSAAETSVEDDAYDDARTSLENAIETTDAAMQRFDDGASILEDEFATEFDTARDRATAVQFLADGYLSILDARDHVTDAESEIEADEYETARTSLDDASTDATTADDDFAIGEDAAGDLFTDEFEAARIRASGIDSLATGYGFLLDARDDITTAESQIEADQYDDARTSLQATSEDTDRAGEEFTAGQADTGSFFETEFQTARDRTIAVGSLSDGYVTLLDARDHVDAGESSFLDEQYDDASTSFETAAEQGREAEITFQDGAEADDEDLFADEFDRALQRTSAIQSLSSGYATMVDAREVTDTSRDHLDNEEFDTAADQFETADEKLTEAETTISDGQADAGDKFATEFDRALCRVGHLRTAIDHFIAAADAGSNRNQSKLEDERDAGEDALDRVEEC